MSSQSSPRHPALAYLFLARRGQSVMCINKSIRQIWHERDSGLFIPEGTVSDSSTLSSQTYLQIKDKALALERLYADNEVALPNGCDLARLIADAKSISDHWLTDHAKLEMTLLFRAVNLDRIADVVLPLQTVTDRAKYLRLLTSSSLDSLDRQTSKAKNLLWELELWSMLRSHDLQAALQEPPDIVVSFEGLEVGLACKKFYSEKHVQNVFQRPWRKSSRPLNLE